MLRIGGILLASSLAASLAASCSRAPEPKQYEVKGQILGIKTSEREVLIKHGDIVGFMPGMTMPFKVIDPALLEGKAAGDLVTATLVVGETDAHLSTLTKTGSAPMDVPAAAPVMSGFELLKTGEDVPNPMLIDQDGKPRPIASLKGHRVALTFMYTRCPMPTFCPMMDRNFAELQGQLKKAPELSDVRLLSVSFDPQFDTPPVLKNHAEKFDADPAVWSFVTGDRDEVQKLAMRFGLGLERDQKNPIEISHTLRTVVIDPQGRLVKVITGNSWKAADLLADLKAVPAAAH